MLSKMPGRQRRPGIYLTDFRSVINLLLYRSVREPLNSTTIPRLYSDPGTGDVTPFLEPEMGQQAGVLSVEDIGNRILVPPS